MLEIGRRLQPFGKEQDGLSPRQDLLLLREREQGVQ
jgi:hypothetical protein